MEERGKNMGYDNLKHQLLKEREQKVTTWSLAGERKTVN